MRGAARLDDLRRFTTDDLRACPPGSGVRVAILDSGVASSLLGDAANEHSFAVRQRGLLGAVERCEPGDVNHHGTAIASILREIAPDAELTSVRLVDDQGRGSSSALRTALAHVIREGFDVVNLSLGTRNRDLLLEVYDLVDQAAVAGVVLVCATDNAGPPDYPAACTSLIAVDRLASADPFALGFRAGHRVGFLARGYDIDVAAPSGARRLVTGASFACAHVAAFAARLRSARPGLHPFEVKTALHAASLAAPVESFPTSAGP